MESVIKKLGKASVTVEKDYHSSEKEYNKLTVVEEQGTFKTYLSRKPVPVGVALTNRDYWISFSGVLESITFDYLKFKRDYASGNALEDNSIITRHILDRNIERIKIAIKAISEEEIDDYAVIERTIKDRNVTSNKIAQENILTEHFAKKSVITAILADYAVTAIKLADNSVTTRTIVNENVTQEKLAIDSVSEHKIVDKNVTNRKIADNTIKIEKLSATLRETIIAATGLPEELVESIQNVDENIAKLNDTVYPITLGFSLTSNVGTMQTEIRYSVSSDNKPLVPDTSIISKQINDNAAKNISTTPSSGGTISTPIEGAREIFKYAVTKEGRTGKSATQTRYLCYHGGNSAATMTAEILNTLNKVSATGVSFNPKVTTKDNDYIWLVVPSYLSINRVTSAGFDVTLVAPQAINNSLGTFKAYRTTNPLTAATWNLVIS